MELWFNTRLALLPTIWRNPQQYWQKYSTMQQLFANYHFHPTLERALSENGFLELTPVQEQSIDTIIKGNDVMICSQTGSGKTLAYLVPLINHLLNQKPLPNTASRSLILLPTRELAMQIFKLCSKLVAYSNLDCVLVTGGQESNYQAAMLRKDPDIIIATPGRLQQHIRERAAELGDVQIAVLDEADRMLDMGFREDVLEIMATAPQPRQTLMLSATLNHRGIKDIADTLLLEPKEITLSTAKDAHEGIRHSIILADDPAHKTTLVRTLIAQGGFNSVIVFANKRDTVDRLSEDLRSIGYTNKLHGEMRQDARKKVIESFRQQRFKVLIATDVAARGLDINDLELVVNYDMPHSGDEYVHRVGRTGRAGKSGEAISLVAPNDWNLSESIQRYLQQRFERKTLKGIEAKFNGPNLKAAKKRKKVKKAETKKTRKPAKKNISSNPNGMSPPKRPKR